jgi:hypothetical protein
MNKYWLGRPPQRCDACGAALDAEFSDMKSRLGSWGNFCPTCARSNITLRRYGTGFGQRYAKQADGRWLKVEG